MLLEGKFHAIAKEFIRESLCEYLSRSLQMNWQETLNFPLRDVFSVRSSCSKSFYLFNRPCTFHPESVCTWWVHSPPPPPTPPSSDSPPADLPTCSSSPSELRCPPSVPRPAPCRNPSRSVSPCTWWSQLRTYPPWKPEVQTRMFAPSIEVRCVGGGSSADWRTDGDRSDCNTVEAINTATANRMKKLWTSLAVNLWPRVIGTLFVRELTLSLRISNSSR